LNLHVSVTLHNQFKAATAAEGKNMTEVLLKFIQGYVEKHSRKPAGKQPGKGRRG
jgi:hypothetical protein